MNESAYSLLLLKLDAFIRKYYMNRLVRGIILSGGLLIGAFLVTAVSEYYFYFGTTVRTILFWSLLLTAFVVLLQLVILPLIHYFRLGKIISHEEAAKIVGNHFSEVQDRLLNILQLREQYVSAQDSSLIEASINQKAAQLKPIPFTAAVQYSSNRKYLRFLVPPLLVFVFILFAAPNVLRESAARLIHNQTAFEKLAPFQFVIQNKNLTAIQYEDYELEVKVNGSALPDEVFVQYEGYPYKLEKKNKNTFVYKFSRLQASVDFNLSAGGFNSKDYKIEVLPKPVILKFETALEYPSYTGRKNESMQNIGDLVVPQGTRIKWRFFSKNTSTISFRLADSTSTARNEGSGSFLFQRRMMKDFPYTLLLSGNQLNNADSVKYTITVVPDMYPQISVAQMQDSTEHSIMYFAGDATDDYGLKKLQLQFQIQHEDSGKTNPQSIPIQISKDKNDHFSYVWDLTGIQLKPGDRVDYFFEVWDNDEVNGSKSSRSQAMVYQMPSLKELENQTEKNNDNIKEKLQSSLTAAQKITEELQKLSDELMQKKDLNWEDKKKMDDLLEKQKKVMKDVENVQQKMNENAAQQNQFQNFSPELKEKQKQLQELANQVLTPEMKDMMEKLKEMMEKMDKEDAMDKLKDQKANNEDLQKELDRMLSLFKKMEFEQKMEATSDKLKELSKEQDDLSKDTENKKDSPEELTKKQDELNKKFDDVQKDLDKLDSLNKELDEPVEMPETQPEEESIDSDQKQAGSELQKKSNSKASKSQKSAADKMKQLADKMDAAMESAESEQMELDMQAIRQILDNLIKISFEQEDLIDQTKATNIYNPKYLQIMKDQKDLEADFKMVEDSIQELSKKVFQIKQFANDQIADIKKNAELSISNLEARQPNVAAVNQQFIMTAVNNLALMFDEVMQQMQQQMANAKPGSAMCKKPGGSKPKPGSMGQMQKQLNDKMNELGEKMKDGKKPGDKPGQKPGQKPGEGSGGIPSEDAAKLAQQQGAIREMLRQLNDQMNKDGKGSLGNLGELQDQMEQTEKELLNKQLTPETLMRQQEILNKLLDAENAQRERDQDNKRESQSGNEMSRPIPPSLEEYLKKKQAELELYKTVSPDLQPFYKSLVEDYFKTLSK